MCSLNEAIARLESQFPNSLVYEEDGVINVVVSNSDAPLQSRTQQIYAPDGGKWSDFWLPPAYVMDLNPIRPYGVVYLPASLTSALIDARTNEILVSFVSDQVASGVSIEDIMESLFEVFGISWTYGQVFFIAYQVASSVYEAVNLYSLIEAYENSSTNKISIHFCTSGGEWPTNLYYEWESNWVSDSPWEEFEPSFYSGNYGGLA